MTDEVEIKPSTGIAVAGIAVALIMLIKPIKALAEMEVGSLVTSIGGIGLLLTAIAMFSQSVEPTGMVSAAAGTTLMAGALTLLVVPVKKLGEMDWEDLQQGIGAVTTLLMGMTVSMVAASQSAGGGAAFALLAVGLTMMLVPIKQLGKMDWKELIDSLSKFAITVSVIAVVATLLEGAVPAIAALAASLITLGASVALIGISLSLLAAGLSVLATLSVAVVTGAVASIGVFLVALTKLVPTFGKLVLEILKTIVDVITGMVSQFVRLVVEIIFTLLRAIRDNISGFMDVTAEIIVLMMKGFGDNAPDLMDAAAEMIIDLINGMTDTLNERGPEFIEAMRRLVGAILVIVIDALVAIVTTVFGWIPGFEGMIAGAGETATAALRDHFDLETPTQEEVDKAKGVIDENKLSFAAKNGVMGKEAKEEFVREFLLEKHTEEEVDAIMKQMDEQKPGVINAAGELGYGMSSLYDENLLITDHTGLATDKINERLIMFQKPAKEESEELSTGMSTGFDSGMMMDTHMSGILGDINKQLDESKDPMKTQGKDIGESIDTGFRTIDYQPIGTYVTSGIRVGLEESSGEGSALWRVCVKVGDAVLRALKVATGIQSPSKYTKEFGVFLVEGLTLGMESMMDSVDTTAGNVGKLALDATNNALDAAMSEFDSEVKVKVLVDTSELDNWVNSELGSIGPNTSFVNRMADASRPNYNQNEDKMYTEPKESNEYNYDVHIHATGELPRATIRRMAHQFKDEIDTIDRRSRINRGEEVVY